MNGMKIPKIDLSKLKRDDQRKVVMLVDCAQALYGTVTDIMPQIGGVVLQDYAALNHGLQLAEALFGKERKTLPDKAHK